MFDMPVLTLCRCFTNTAQNIAISYALRNTTKNPKSWFEKVGGPNPDEEDMLDLAVDLQPTSRLGCQVEINNELDGLVVKIPNEF